MWKYKIVILLIACSICLNGCHHGIPIEKVNLFLLLGIDCDEEGDFLVGTISPFLQEDASKNTTENIVKAKTIYEAYAKINTSMNGVATASKEEILLIGRNVANNKKWMGELDGIFRDPRSSTNAKILIVDGPVMEAFKMKLSDKPMLPIYLKELIQSTIHSNMAVPSTVQKLLRQLNDKGVTQSVPIIKVKRKKVIVTGLAFLNQTGKFVESIPVDEVPLFQLLNRQKKRGEMKLYINHISFHNKKEEATAIKEEAKREVNFNVKNGVLYVDFNLYITASIIEKTNSKPIQSFSQEKQNVKRLEKQMKRQLDNRFGLLMQHIKRDSIDPLGIGAFLRAYKYNEWKRLEQNWPNAISNSKLKVHTDIKIQNTGIVRG
ncbi:Ger(x)C family spore germination protein [Bacillus cereus group sp. BfR-BA-01349]|uniref:Ger(x)C family spore germination protein n=1 Tax=Bacillus cereus group sp. BfR-BA-01349 TaxID=2920312 RepID=UPI001F58E9F2